MSFNFVIPEFNIGGEGSTPPTFQFYKKGFRISGSPSPTWQDIILKGNTALTLVNAKADSLEYLKLFGGTEQRNLPSGYTQLEYLESDGTQYIKTGIKPASGYKVRCKYIKKGSGTSPTVPFGCTSAANPNDARDGIYRVHGSGTNRIAYGNGNDTTLNLGSYDSTNTVYDVICNGGIWTINGNAIGTIISEAWSQNYYDIWLFARNTGGVVGLAGSWQIMLCQIWDGNGNLVFDCLPCKNSSNVLGMYDTVSGNFLTNQGTGDFTAGANIVPSPDTPMDIVCNNGVLGIDSQCNITVTGTTETVEIDTTGDTATAENLFKVGTYQDVQNVITGEVTRNVGICVCTGQEGWAVQNADTIPDVYFYRTGTDSVQPNTAICSHYKGVSSSSSVNNLGNGEMKYGYGSQPDRIYIRDTRFNNDTVGFKAYLSQQYNAGNPIIIMFPLETATTETVTPQPMNIQAGTNIVEITQASMDGLELEVKYKAGVSVTITEIENVQSDNGAE